MVSEGDNIPFFEGIDQQGKIFKVKEYIGNQVLVIYFYPKNFTPGCTAEACSFRDHYEIFKSQGATIIGISNNTADSHSRFIERYQLPFTLIADNENRIRKHFGVKPLFLGLLPGRETFVVDKKGIVRLRFNSVQAKKHIPKALGMIKTLNDL